MEIEIERDSLFGNIALAVARAVALFRLGDTGEAAGHLKKAYELAAPGRHFFPFIEQGSDMHSLITALQRDGLAGDFDESWLDRVKNQAGIYAKNLRLIANECSELTAGPDDAPLTAREIQMLEDLYHGFSRQEIAAHHYISINTVKTILGALYEKLGAKSNIDAVRIALDRKLIG